MVAGIAVTVVVGGDTSLIAVSRSQPHGYKNRKQRRQEEAGSATVKMQLAKKRRGGGVEGKKKSKGRQVI